MSKVKPAVKPVVKSNAKTDAVFAFTKRGGGYRIVRVSEFMSYGDAVERFARFETYNRNAGTMHAQVNPHKARSTRGAADTAPLGAGGGPVIWLAVRSKDDPRFKDAPRATVVTRDKAARKARAAIRAI